MKKAFTFIAAAAFILCSAGCQKQELQKDEFGGQTINLTLEATRGDATDTKTTISYNDEYASLESVWNTGDKVYVYSRKSGEKIGELTQTGDIVNQKTSATAQYATSYAKFTGSVTLGTGDVITDDYAFVYQGAGRSLDVSGGKLTYEIGTKATVAELNAWDLAYATGKIQGTAGTDGAASCAVSFTNKLAFGYFTTAGLEETGLSAQYYSGFTFDVKTGTVTGTRGAVSLPAQQAFYMPLIPGEVNMDCGKTWTEQSSKLGYTTTKQSKSFTAAAGSYYRLGRSSNFGPVAFIKTAWTLYETLKDSKFKVDDNPDRYVYFTQGNLQYIGSATTPYWRVAPDQYSYLGANQGCPTSVDVGSKIPTNTDVDLFGWGEVTTPFKGSTVNSDYQPTLNGTELAEDWATKFNGGSPVTLYADATQSYPKNGTGNYCCLTKDEWTNLFDNQWWGLATVNMNDGTTVNGLVVVPNVGADASAIESHARGLLTGAIYKSSATIARDNVAFTDNSINQSVIDNNGLLFLPAAGVRSNLRPSLQISDGDYYTISAGTADLKAYFLSFGRLGFNIMLGDRYRGCSVRLAIVVLPTQD